MNDCIHLNCVHNRSGGCLDPVLKDPCKQTGCLFHTGKNIPDYPKSEEDCKFCIDRWYCNYKHSGKCTRKE